MRQRLAHRLPARLGRRSGTREEAGERDPAHPGHARQGRRVRTGVGLRLPVRLPPHRPASAMAACCSPATRRTRSRLSAPVAPTPASRTWTTWCGSSSSCSMGTRPRHCSTRTTRSAPSRPTTTCCNSTRSTDFITPKSRASRVLRDAVLQLAQRAAVRARAGQQRPAVDADALPALLAQHAGRGQLRRRSCVPEPTAPTRR